MAMSKTEQTFKNNQRMKLQMQLGRQPTEEEIEERWQAFKEQFPEEAGILDKPEQEEKPTVHDTTPLWFKKAW